jgi:NADH:ubiquinone oxidoreductase subunit 5 (subunit L)/multisubunit Na+/H+ antiporter MnhA subunit
MADAAWLLPLAIALPFAAAAAVGVAGRALGLRGGWLLAVAAAGSFVALGKLALTATAAPLRFEVPWLPAIDVAFALRGDAFGVFFALLVSGIGVLVVLYSLAYLDRRDLDRAPRYYASLAVFMGSMLGIALADDLIVIFVAWELTSISSFLLIGYRFEDDDAKAGALTALQVTALGGLVMSAGFLLIAQVTGTFSLSLIASDPARIERLLSSPLGTWALILVFCGAFTKSAQVPFHFWLPRAMVAPTPISAYLHAATMVKAGVFLVGRMLPIFGESPLWLPVLVAVGGTTMLLGAYQATRETDLKAILASTTVSALGLLFLLYGLGAAEQDALQILNHALYKGTLFLVAGIVEHHAHTRDLRRLGGLRDELPIAFAACALGALSMAGIVPLLGFLAKEAFYGALLENEALARLPLLRVVVLAASLLTSAFLAATAYRLTAGVFLGARHGDPHARAAHDWLWVSPVALALGALTLGLLGAGSATGRLARTFSSRPGGHLELSLLPHAAGPLLASVAAVALAVIVHRGREPVIARVTRLSVLPPAAAVWQGALAAVARAGEEFSRWWENGSLRWYLAATVMTLPALVVVTFWGTGAPVGRMRVDLGEMSWYGLLCCGLLAVATVATVRARTRLAAAIASSAIGFLVAMLYVVYRSPDILLTQILIETVSTIFVLLVLVHLPKFPLRDLPPRSRLANGAIAACFGLTMTVLLLLAMTPGLREADNIATRPGGLLSLSLAQGGGANAVNVIIVDIRALDTNGEITVLVVVGLCIYGLLRARRSNA